MGQNKKNKSELRRNIKLPDDVFFALKALNKVKPIKQYELIDVLVKHYISSLSDMEKQFFEYQLEEIKKAEGGKGKPKNLE
ncbi:hypothetical protein N0B21_20335 [Bacillus velezensis]|uniref:hypothetical protein n=1 Tax=Bacillus amyloliquefaciens group TaxID=1938374 RepID=UPI00080C6806|nr:MULTISPECIES: hypothetical protein [Bacillus amyloliquefaciens group]MCT6684532.1 hypothetical protein [Bacillus velezensis]OCB94469.1 hypothetical protein SRCM101294_02651 [Bacillus amyloliquefaciens]